MGIWLAVQRGEGGGPRKKWGRGHKRCKVLANYPRCVEWEKQLLLRLLKQSVAAQMSICYDYITNVSRAKTLT